MHLAIPFAAGLLRGGGHVGWRRCLRAPIFSNAEAYLDKSDDNPEV